MTRGLSTPLTNGIVAGPMLQLCPMEATAADLGRLRALFDANGSPKDDAVLTWRYLDNPTGELFVDFAIDPERDGQVAGTYCVSPVQFKIGDRQVLGAQSIDTLTDQHYRGRGLFKKLAAHTYARCADRGVGLVYGFPNHRSAFGFFERLAWTRMDPVPFLVRGLRAGYVARRLGVPAKVADFLSGVALGARPPRLARSQDLRVVLEFDDAFDELWGEFARDVPVAAQRSSRYLRWRFSANPSARYKTYGLYEAGGLVGYVIFRVVDKHGGRVGYVMELIHRPGRVDVGRALLQQAIHDIALDGGEVVLAWNLSHSPNRASYRRTGFVPLPRRLRPIELHFGARHLGEERTEAVCNRRNWYLSYCDSDTV